MEMGHGDELVIADGNFPSASIAQRLVRADGLWCLILLDAILDIFPLDHYAEKPVTFRSFGTTIAKLSNSMKRLLRNLIT